MVWPLLYRFKILWLSCAYLVPRFCVMSLVAREVSAWCRGCQGEALAYSCREMWSLYAKGVRSRIRACRAVGRMVINHFALVRFWRASVCAAWLQGRTADPFAIHLLKHRGMQIVQRLRDTATLLLKFEVQKSLEGPGP